MASQAIKRALIFVESGDRATVELVAGLSRKDYCAVAVSSGQAAELKWRAGRQLARLLVDDGHVVDLALSAKAALELLAKAIHPHALIADVSRRQSEAIAVARYARGMFPGVPIIFITNYPDLLVRNSNFDPPPILFTKPLDYPSLRATLEALEPVHPVLTSIPVARPRGP
jgi:CheY-like chemotaxis protein